MLKIKKINPMFTSIVTTGEKFKEDMYDEHGVIEASAGDLKAYQKVIAVGPSVRGIEPGDTVMVNFMNYAVRKYKAGSMKENMEEYDNSIEGFKFNWITLDVDGKPQECLLLSDRDVLFSFEGEEVQGKKPKTAKAKIIVPDNKIITN